MLLVDGCNALVPYAAVEARLAGRSGFLFNAKACDGFRSAVAKAQAATKAGAAVVFWDGGRSPRRRMLFPAYKAHRTGLDGIEDAIALLGDLASVQLPHREADDCMALAARLAAEAGSSVTIASTDQDFYQLASDRVRIYNHRKRVLVTAEGLRRQLGISPAQVLLVQAVAGDASDGIPGIPGVGRKTALRWVASSGAETADELVVALRFVKGKLGERARDGFTTVRRNLELMDLGREVFTPAEIGRVRTRLEKSPSFLTSPGSVNRRGASRAHGQTPDNDYLSRVGP